MQAASWIAMAAVGALLVGGIIVYNRVIRDRNLARQGFADIDVQLKRRADLVPRLVEAVPAYAAYEKALFTAVTDLRVDALKAASLATRFGAERALGERLCSSSSSSTGTFASRFSGLGDAIAAASTPAGCSWGRSSGSGGSSGGGSSGGGGGGGGGSGG